uniref:Reverse transcriptase domain-containing protein n=1 Tax=Plectus sambesii TaxID=2011161 RepID=A0A914X6S7_9BILA
MEIQPNSSTNATASRAANAPALGIQGAGEKWATGQRIKFTTPKLEICIAVWNVQTGHHIGQKEIIAMELSKCKISIAAVSELRLTGSGTLTIPPPTIDKTTMLFYSGGKKQEAGIGFMVDRQAARSVIAFQPISDHLAVLTINGTVKTHILSTYAPTETSSDAAKDDFYSQLQHTLDMIPQTELIILAGDFNSHTGADRIGWEETLGRFGHGKINDNGLRLLSFAALNNLVVDNSHFQHPRKHQLTWRNPSGKDSAILDYILISSRFRSSLKDVRAMRGPDCGFDHYLIRAKTLRRLSGKSKSTNDNIKKVDGTFVSSPCEHLQQWKDFSQWLYNHDLPQGPPPEPPPVDSLENPFLISEPTVDEVKNAIRSLKNGKAPGVDQVTAKMIKAGGDILLQWLHIHLIHIWCLERVPSAWKKAIIMPILKKGNSRECKNYHCISLLSIVGKVFMKIIQSRLQKHCEQSSQEEQAEFRPHQGFIDQIFGIHQLVEERIRHGKQTIIIFINFKSTFDCVYWPILWRVLENEHVPLKIIQLLQAPYNGSTSSVQIQNELS